MSWCSDVPEDETISLFAALLANHDVPLSLVKGARSTHPSRGVMLDELSLTI
jgi:hypothetical protein